MPRPQTLNLGPRASRTARTTVGDKPSKPPGDQAMEHTDRQQSRLCTRQRPDAFTPTGTHHYFDHAYDTILAACDRQGVVPGCTTFASLMLAESSTDCGW